MCWWPGCWPGGAARRPTTASASAGQRITQHGRITDGNILDVQELDLNGRGSAQMLIYQYDVAGVTYEASQDITYLRHQVDLYSCRLGLATSVKYDPHNPGDSIVVAEGWTGLRK